MTDSKTTPKTTSKTTSKTSSAAEPPPAVINLDEAPELERLFGDHWGGAYKIMTPAMRPGGGRLGVNWMRVPAGRAACPFHSHQREDEVFFILSGRGVLRRGDDELTPLRAGDCVSCPSGTGVAHQIANPFDEDLVYLSIGDHDPDEVCVYPDTDKIMVRGLQRVGRLADTPYFDGEPERPKILDLVAEEESRST